MVTKTPSTFKLSDTTKRLLKRLRKRREYRSQAHVIEMLVYREAVLVGLVKPGNGTPCPTDQPQKE
jgi:hypothetical protein